MGLQTFQNKSLVIDGLFLNNLYEILIYFVVVDGSQCTHFSSFSFALKDKMINTS